MPPSFQALYFGSGKPSTRLDTTLMFTSDVPPSIELPFERSQPRAAVISPAKSGLRASDEQTPSDSSPKVGSGCVAFDQYQVRCCAAFRRGCAPFQTGVA